MDERIAQFRVGVMVVATLLIAAILVAIFGEFPSLLKKKHLIKIRFEQAQAVTKDTPVRKSGILVGRVTEIVFAEDIHPGERGVIVTAKLERPFRDDETCEVVTNLMGDAELRIFRPDKEIDKEPLRIQLQKQHYVNGRAADDPTGLKKALEKPITKIETTAVALAEAAAKITEVLEKNEAGIRRAIDRADSALESIDNFARNANELIGDEETRRRLRTSIEKLPGTLDQLPETLDQMRTTMKEAENRLTEMRAFTQSLGSPEMVQRIEEGTKNLDRVMADLAAFSGSLKSPKGSLGLLLTDRKLYDNLSQAAENVDDLSRQLKPILNDVRVFTDKIARHPERLGAQGVIQKYSGIK